MPAPRATGTSIECFLADARANLRRVSAQETSEMLTRGDAFVVDIRPVDRRERDGHIPGAVVVDRLVLEWRLDPTSPWRMHDGPGPEDVVVLVCNEGYGSSLAARDLQALGLPLATDLIGGFAAWAAAGLPVSSEPTRVVH